VSRSAVVLLVSAVLALTGCSTVPTSSPTVQITQAAPRPDSTVTIEPLSPDPGATPDQIVRGFIDAAASTVRGHPVAREHLTPAAARTWSDEAAITVLSADYATVTTEAGRVQVTANVIGSVDQQGIFTIGDRSVFTREFSLQKVKGEWRIADPPDGLLMLQPDFERLYDQVAAYFVDPTEQRVVPDIRYLITGAAQPTALVERLLAGPSTTLAPGVRNALTGVQLRRAVTISDLTATVDLTGLPNVPRPVLSEICAQLVWTLDQLRGQVRSVRVLVDGEPVSVPGLPLNQTTQDWIAFDPGALPVDAVGHYINSGAVRTVTKGDPAPGPAGKGTYKLSSAAAVADPRTGELSFMVGVTGPPGKQTLVAGSYGKALTSVLGGDGTTLTVPTVAATRTEAWVVRNGTDVIRVPAGGAPQAVSAKTLTGLGRADALELSPDGVRAALAIQGRLYVGTVVRGDDGSVALRDLRAIAPSLSQVSDVAWRDSGTLLVLAGDAAGDRTVPYSLGVDGWKLEELPTSGLGPSEPTSIAAAPTQQPLVSAGGTIWQLAGGTWVTLIAGQRPLPGTQPFFPL
jgi:hypothetical protein